MAKRGRPRAHRDEQITQAILDLGIDTFSLPDLARELGLSAHSGLYRYFPDREAMVDAALSRAVLSVGWPSPRRQWERLLRAIGESVWTVCETYEGFDRAALDHQWLQARIELLDGYYRALHVEGFTEDDAKVAVDLVTSIALRCHASARGRSLYDRQLDIVIDGLRQALTPG